MKEISKIIFFLLRLISSELCCFHDWSTWQESPLTCGQVCKQRMRDRDHLGIFWGSTVAEEDCNNDHPSCPSNESDNDCVYIDCRELNLKNCSRIKFCVKALFC